MFFKKIQTIGELMRFIIKKKEKKTKVKNSNIDFY